jgi:hypothetical protein
MENVSPGVYLWKKFSRRVKIKNYTSTMLLGGPSHMSEVVVLPLPKRKLYRVPRHVAIRAHDPFPNGLAHSRVDLTAGRSDRKTDSVSESERRREQLVAELRWCGRGHRRRIGRWISVGGGSATHGSRLGVRVSVGDSSPMRLEEVNGSSPRLHCLATPFPFWGNCVSTPISNSNCDFTPYFLTLWFYPYYFKLKL